MRSLHHYVYFLRRVKLWHLLVFLIFLTGLSAVLLRQNNLGMIERRNLVKMADQQDGDVQAALSELQRYVGTHMNTNMGQHGIYLEKTYQRAYERAIRQATERHTPTGAVYTQAEQECKQRSPVFQVFVQCVADKVGQANPSQDPLSAIQAPPVDLFRHDFSSPRWSPDAAGWSVLITGVLATLVIVQTGARMAARAALKRRYQ